MKRLFFLSFVIAACTSSPPEVKYQKINTGTDTLLQAIDIIDKNVIWMSGHASTFVRSVDGGESWKIFHYSEVDSLQFRDIHAIDDQRAVLMSAGPGALSRILMFSTEDGWKETYVMEHEEGFLNTIEFWDAEMGLAFGDSFNGELFILRTEDGGNSWNRIDPEVLPPAGEGEGGFAASGTCIATRPGGLAWIGTGAGGNSRILRTADFGDTWEISESPLLRGDAAGITSIRMATDEVGTIVGGDLTVTDTYTANVAYTEDGGKNWTLAGFPNTKGALYGSDIIPYEDLFFWIAGGPNGIDYTWDMGKTWINLDTANFWAVDMHEDGFGYAAGKDGSVIRILIE